jgi:hypothetical protein
VLEADGRGVAIQQGAWVRRRGEKPAFTHPIVVIGFGVDVLLTLNFNEGKFLCAIFWIHNG